MKTKMMLLLVGIVFSGMVGAAQESTKKGCRGKICWCEPTFQGRAWRETSFTLFSQTCAYVGHDEWRWLWGSQIVPVDPSKWQGTSCNRLTGGTPETCHFEIRGLVKL